MRRRPPRSTQGVSSAASDVYKRQEYMGSGDGCTGDCMKIEDGYECPTPGILCNLICKNGRLDAGEECDDNITGSAGCNSSCILQRGYFCPMPNSTCQKLCGDEVVQVNIPYSYQSNYSEECDDGNYVNGDGCNTNCKLETKYQKYSYSETSYYVSKEIKQSSATIIVSFEYDCKAPYLPTQEKSYYNPRPSSDIFVCYKGRHCLNCSYPKFPGYPIEYEKFTAAPQLSLIHI
eukprot:TRINITY_DN15467_c0_g1_i8.p2 TRINITY_DN15467_c0_g1~~TRINITY_DN15467_c0_g1_i8.p2  ORF type:complete len:233 (-),score=31.97 TRINITY_DN15467_c0_g1_i8:110-808(-)